MEFRVLKYFLTIAQEENMTRAAAILHLTQPTLSRQSMMLEDELGVQLFVRGRYNMTLTPEGEFLKKRSEGIIALSESTQRDIMKGEATLGGTISISIGCGDKQHVLPLRDEDYFFTLIQYISIPSVKYNSPKKT